jgi:hypothetical protein
MSETDLAPADAPPAPAALPPSAPPPPPRRVPREWVGRAALESVLIVLSVLLGFAISEWRDRRATRARAVQALAAIEAEIDSNRVLVQNARVHHRAFADTVARYVAAGTPVPERVYLYSGMFNPARVIAVAWESARDGGALAQLPYPLVLRLARVYARQAQYHGLTEAMINGIYGDMMVRGIPAAFRDNASSWNLLLRDFADRDGRLEVQYDSVLVHVRAERRR